MSVKHEEMIVGQIVKDPDIIHDIKIKSGDFTSAKVRRIFMAVLSLSEKNIIPDIVSIIDHDREIDPGLLAQVTNVPTTANWRYYHDQILRASNLVALKKISSEIIDGINSGEDPDVIISGIEKGIHDIALSTNTNVKTMQSLVGDYIKQIEKRYNDRGALPGYATGYKKLDGCILGLRKRTLTVIAARPSDGKSATMANIALNMAMGGIRVGIINIEDDNMDTLNRMVANISEINSQSLMMGYLSDKDFSKVMDTATSLYEKNIFFYDTGSMNQQEMKNVCRKLTHTYGAQVIFIDYIQKIKHTNKNLRRHEAVADIVSTAKEISKDLNIPVVALAQVGRSGDNKIPSLSDLKESGQIEQEADVVLFIYHKRSEYGDEIEESSWIVAKARNGRRGNIRMKFEGHFLRFLEE